MLPPPRRAGTRSANQLTTHEHNRKLGPCFFTAASAPESGQGSANQLTNHDKFTGLGQRSFTRSHDVSASGSGEGLHINSLPMNKTQALDHPRSLGIMLSMLGVRGGGGCIKSTYEIRTDPEQPHPAGTMLLVPLTSGEGGASLSDTCIQAAVAF